MRIFVLILISVLLFSALGIMPAFCAEKVKVVAHRGASAYAPENTMASFKKAIEMKADYLELDVHMSRDGELIVIHDEDVDRTTDGKGAVRDMTLKELKKLDAGSWFFDDFKGEKLPTLAEALDLAKGKIGVLIEIKNGPIFYEGIEQKVADLVKEKGMVDDVIVISFDHQCLKTLNGINPKIKTGVLYDANILNPHRVAQDAGAVYIGPSQDLLTESAIKDCHKNGIKVNPWTVNKPERMKQLVNMGVNAITTNNPDVLRKIVDGQ